MPSSTFLNLPAQKQEKLLEAATREFSQRPYTEASINQIIKEAGIPRGSFYMYFRDKEELFHYLLKRYQDGLLQRLERVLEEQGGDLLGALPALFDDLRELGHAPGPAAEPAGSAGPGGVAGAAGGPGQAGPAGG